jgi:hypothetical protein
MRKGEGATAARVCSGPRAAGAGAAGAGAGAGAGAAEAGAGAAGAAGAAAGAAGAEWWAAEMIGGTTSDRVTARRDSHM